MTKKRKLEPVQRDDSDGAFIYLQYVVFIFGLFTDKHVDDEDEVVTSSGKKDIEQLLADAENSGITQLDSNRFVFAMINNVKVQP